MSLIILGLLMMFSQTQRAFMSSMTQVDVLEGGRDVMDMLVNDLQNMAPSQLPNTLNFYADTNEMCPNPASLQALPGNLWPRTNFQEKFFFLTKNNLSWTAVGYQVVTNDATGCVGSLYRFSSTNLTPYAPAFQTRYLTNTAGVPPYSFWNQRVFTSSNKLADGVVDFRVRAFATNGAALTVPIGSPPVGYYEWPAWFRVSGLPVSSPYLPPTNQIANTYAAWRSPAGSEPLAYYFWSNAMPASVEIEVGILESRLLKTYQGLGSFAAQMNYLSNHAANVHIFRQRINLANVDPNAY